MRKEAREALDAYYAEGDSWARDHRDEARKSRRIAWIVAGCLGGVAVIEAIALIVMTPLKTVEPYTLLVDRQTGFVQTLKPLDPQMISGESALTQSFLVQYVIAREGYDINALQSDYRKVGLWSAGEARRGYVARMQASNPESPLAKYPRSTSIDVTIKSVTEMSKGVAMVRYDTQRRDVGGRVNPPQAWVSVLRYGYSGAPMTAADRMINPLGFQVAGYRRSIEMLPAVEQSRSQLQPAIGTNPLPAVAPTVAPRAPVAHATGTAR